MKEEEEKRSREEKEERVGEISWLPEFQIAATEIYSLKKKIVYGRTEE